MSEDREKRRTRHTIYMRSWRKGNIEYAEWDRQRKRRRIKNGVTPLGQHLGGHGDNPEQKKARRRLEHLVATGKYTKPGRCEECGRDPGHGRAGQSLLFGHIIDCDPHNHEWLCSYCLGDRRHAAWVESLSR